MSTPCSLNFTFWKFLEHSGFVGVNSSGEPHFLFSSYFISNSVVNWGRTSGCQHFCWIRQHYSALAAAYQDLSSQLTNDKVSSKCTRHENVNKHWIGFQAVYKYTLHFEFESFNCWISEGNFSFMSKFNKH